MSEPHTINLNMNELHTRGVAVSEPYPLQAASHAAQDGDGQFCHCCFPCVLYREERGYITIIQL